MSQAPFVFESSEAMSHVLVTSLSIQSVDVFGITDSDGNPKDFDVVVFETGFITNPFLLDITVTGRDSTWADKGGHAFWIVTKHGIPNLFMLY
jgi:cation diffusion facilitator CzcD-associated flavoprotein CzcO